MDIKNQEWLEIFLWFRCNIRCEFCYQKDLRKEFKKNIEKEEVFKMIERGVNDWKKFIIFSWWEPTLDMYLPNYIEFAKKLWYEHIRVHTNGFWFQKYEYLEDLYRKWLTWVTLSVHWYYKIHDFITKVDWSFDIIKKSLINFEKLRNKDKNFILDTNTVVCKNNFKDIPKVVKFLTYFSVIRWQIVLTYSLELFSEYEKKYIIPKYSEIIPFLTESIDISFLKNKKFVLENIPFCVIDEKYWESILNNIKINKDSITINEWNAWNTNLRWVYKSEKCKKCKMKEKCRWIPIDYYKIYWDSELKTLL